MKREENQPDNLVFEQRIGSVRLSIWENVDKEGNCYYSSNIVRRFKAGDEWSNSSSFTGLSDLALLREAVELAIAWHRGIAFPISSNG